MLYKALCVFCLCAVTDSAQEVNGVVARELPTLVDTYKDLHEHPEISHQEKRTSGILAKALRQDGWDVTEHVGKYPNGNQAYGVVAVLKNGTGPRLMIRADMDALPIQEETGVAYASRNAGVMHACGHDVHTTVLIGVGQTLAAMKDRWHGTVMLVGQPSEETIDGAKAMMNDSLYERFGKPDMILALHDSSGGPAGTVAITSGVALASATSIDVTMRGISGHGARPQAAKDPVVMAAEFIMELQTVVSRQEDPSNPTVVTVGDIHGGTRRNIIPTEVKMEITTRSFSEQAREIVLDGIRRTARGVALAAGVPADREPIVTVLEDESTPALYNDPVLAAKSKMLLQKALGAENVTDQGPAMPSEDFGIFGMDHRQIPTFMFWLNAMEPAQFAAARAQGKELPGPHNSRFEPAPEATLKTGVTAMTSLAIGLLQ